VNPRHKRGSLRSAEPADRPAAGKRSECVAPSCSRTADDEQRLAPAAAVTEGSPEPITRRTSSAEVGRRVLAARVARLVRALARVLVDEDAEWIHQARSAARALRANLAAFAPLLDSEEAAQLETRLRALGTSLGCVRDNDVLIEHISILAQRLPDVGAPTVDGLLERCRAAREHAYLKLASELRDDAYPRLLEDLVRSVCRDTPLIAHPQALRRKTLVHDVIEEPWRRLNRAVRDCGDDPTPEQLHAIRIKVKRCRYAAEAVVPLVRDARAAAAQRFVTRLTRLQDTLGAFVDAVNESNRLRELSSSKLDRFVAGEVAGLEVQIATTARASWRKAWKRVSKREVRFWRSA
jgi:CHAD domain-containing protein